MKNLKDELSFRLLTEYHSFLLYIVLFHDNNTFFLCFRLLTEYHSFLSKIQVYILL